MDPLFVSTSLVSILSLVFISKRIYRQHSTGPRTLVSSDPLGAGNPRGLLKIDGVKVRDGDNVILTQQSNADLNGRWVASKGLWTRYHLLSLEFGTWALATHGSNKGTLWLCISGTSGIGGLESTIWEEITTGRALIPVNSSDFAPNNPIEAAVFLHGLGVPPSRIQVDRDLTINSLVLRGDISGHQGELLRMKPENLISDVLTSSGQRALLAPEWGTQVQDYMTRIGEPQIRFLTRTYEHFTRVPLVGFSRIKAETPTNPPEQIERRSRYEREPLI